VTTLNEGFHFHGSAEKTGLRERENVWGFLARDYLDRGPIRWHRLPVIRRLAHGTSDHVWLNWNGRLSLLLKSPSLVAHVLSANEANYWKRPHGYTSLVDTFQPTGRRLLRLDRDAPSDRNVQSRASIDSCIVDFIRVAVAGVIERAEGLTEANCLDIDREVKAALFALAGRVLWNIDVSDLADMFVHAINEFERFWVAPPEPNSPHWPQEIQRYAWSLEVRDRVLDEVIRRGDLRSKSPADRSELRLMVLETLLNAHFPLASSVVFTLALLARHSSVLEAVRTEVAAIAENADRTLESARALPLTQAAVQESLRLYPPAWLLSRETAAADTLPNGVRG